MKLSSCEIGEYVKIKGVVWLIGWKDDKFYLIDSDGVVVQKPLDSDVEVELVRIGWVQLV